MITVTEQKPFEEILQSLEKCPGVYLIGCGSCTTMLHTGGKSEVLEMKGKLEAAGKKVTGWMVIPTACDNLTKDALSQIAEEIDAADCILVLACGFGVQTVVPYTDKPVYPALDTLFTGRGENPYVLSRMWRACGKWGRGQYAGSCPLIQCAKGLISGTCGGSQGGKCEQGPERDCAWILIYERLKKFGALDKLKEFVPPRDYSKMQRPRQIEVSPH